MLQTTLAKRTATQDATTWGPADQAYGYRFGCDGLVGPETAMELLGSISRSTLDRLAAKGAIRKGRHAGGGRVVFCRRSVEEYIQSLEV